MSAEPNGGSVRYRTIVADPPWDHSDNTGWSFGTSWNPSSEVRERHRIPDTQRRHGPPRGTTVPYSTMTLAEIHALPIAELAADDAHLYLWTTNRYLRASFDVVEAWGFSVRATLVWCKQPKGFMGGAYRASTEFVQFARRGSLAHQIQAPSTWFQWPRSLHSKKPEAFLDLVEQVSPGPYLELFARRQRLGWDTWGDQALEHVELASGL